MPAAWQAIKDLGRKFCDACSMQHVWTLVPPLALHTAQATHPFLLSSSFSQQFPRFSITHFVQSGRSSRSCRSVASLDLQQSICKRATHSTCVASSRMADSCHGLLLLQEQEAWGSGADGAASSDRRVPRGWGLQPIKVFLDA